MIGILGNFKRVIQYKWFPKTWALVRISKNHKTKIIISINKSKVPFVVGLPVRIDTRIGFPFYSILSIHRQHCGHRATYMMFDEHDILRCGICGEYRRLTE